MKYIFIVLLLLVSCSATEYGDIEFITCPTCLDAYVGFETCAFFDAQPPYVNDHTLVDHDHAEYGGIPIDVGGYMHHKFCFNDTHVAFGSANPTRSGLGKNDNYIVRMQSKTAATAFAAEYDYLRGKGSGKHAKKWQYNDHEIELLFCPRDNCEKRIVQELVQSTASIQFLAFSFTSDAIADTLLAKYYENVSITGVMEPWGATGRGGEYTRLSKAGIPIILADTPGLMHAKAFIIDAQVAIIGSYNPTANANTRNAEAVMITREPEIIAGLLRLQNNLFK